MCGGNPVSGLVRPRMTGAHGATPRGYPGPTPDGASGPRDRRRYIRNVTGPLGATVAFSTDPHTMARKAGQARPQPTMVQGTPPIRFAVRSVSADVLTQREDKQVPVNAKTKARVSARIG